MERLQEEALELLEFPKVLLHLAAYTFFAPAKEEALALRPSFDPGEVTRRQQETQDAARLLEAADEIDTSGAIDVRSALQRAALEGVLTGEEIRQVLQTLQTCRQVRAALLRHRQEAGFLATLAEGMPVLRDLEREIERCIGPSGEVLDSASPELARARQQARDAYQRLERALQRIIRSSLGQEALQEPLITQRSSRLVLPVRAEMRHRLPGLVHDISQTGATVFIEPAQTIEMGNAWREWVLQEQWLADQVVRQVSAQVSAASDQVGEAVHRLTQLDLALAKARYGRALRARAPALWEGERPWVRLVEARHPLLKGEVVPVSLQLGLDHPVLLLTGPNAGGKTVTLKAVGVLALMHQAGLQAPAEQGTTLPIFDAVYADIGDRQSLEQALSTFSSHMRSLVAILQLATPSSLVLLDELGASTDPEEGAALAKAVLADLARRDVATIATTHHRSVAAFVETTPGMVNASVELHPDTLQPTYRLSMGLPGRSYALVMASRLGMPQHLVEEARATLDPTHRHAEELLAELQRERFQAARLRQEAEAVKRESERLQAELQARLAELNGQRGEVLAQARWEMASRVEELQKRLRQAERTVEDVEAKARVREALGVALEAQREVKGKEWRVLPEEQPPWWRSLKPGDWVRVKGFDLQAKVAAPPDREGRVEVQLGAVRARFDLERLVPLDAPPIRQAEGPKMGMGVKQGGPFSMDLDLHGVRVEEALERVEHFLDQALFQGMSQVRIIHGIGTGALRQAVRERLNKHPLVALFRPDEISSGGDGATLVTLA